MQLDACAVAPDSWTKQSIGEVCRRITSGGTPARNKPEFFSGGSIGWVKTKELIDGFISETEETITPAAIASSSAKVLPAGTILLAMYGATVGMLGILSKEMACNQACCAMQVKDNFDRDFLFYQLLAHRHQLQGLATGAAQQNLSGKQIKDLILPFPSLEEQRAISGFLRSLDDRIASLREINVTLEAIAQALFKSWFVDFDPVRAKMEGRAPEGMDEATAALFPDALKESGVPIGWTRGRVGDLMKLHKGSINPATRADEVFQHFSLPAFDDGAMPVLELGSAIKSNKTSVPTDAILVSKLNPRFPRIWIPSDVRDNAICSTEFLPMIPTELSTQAFNYCLASSPAFTEKLEQLVTGTSSSHQRVKPDSMLVLESVIPPLNVVIAFDEVALPILDAVKNNRYRIQVLADLRDTLLPRLISGKLRLPQRSRFVPELIA